MDREILELVRDLHDMDTEILALVRELPNRSDWSAGFASIRDSIRDALAYRGPKRRPYRISSGPRLAGYRLRAAWRASTC